MSFQGGVEPPQSKVLRTVLTTIGELLGWEFNDEPT